MTKGEYRSIKQSLRYNLNEARGAFANWRNCKNCAEHTTSLYCDEDGARMQRYADAQEALGNHVRMHRY